MTNIDVISTSIIMMTQLVIEYEYFVLLVITNYTQLAKY